MNYILQLHVDEIRILFDRLRGKFLEFEDLCDFDKFVFLFNLDGAEISSWLG